MLWLSALAAILSFAIPLYVNNPLHLQGERELRFALGIVQWHPWIEGIAGIAGLSALLLALRVSQIGTRRRTLWLPASLIAASFALSHVDVYSLIFHRMDNPKFEAARSSGVKPAEPVLAVTLNGAARAYPVRPLAYHHVVNDVLGRVPIAATW